MVKYCGLELGKQITAEQVERLFNFLHANYTKQDLIMLRQEELNAIAQNSKEEWF